nr:beta-defensin 131A-like [Vulpes vulpes]
MGGNPCFDLCCSIVLLEYLNCRMKCNPDEHAIKYCADWTICCKAKNTKFKRKKKW